MQSNWGNPLKTGEPLPRFWLRMGAFLRLFWKDVEVSNLFGYDVIKMIVDTAIA
jgi:hypothetical protein